MFHFLLQEYYSVAHCVAGGFASVATSFIFTPSERIKQQLQVGSHYHNCWYISSLVYCRTLSINPCLLHVRVSIRSILLLLYSRRVYNFQLFTVHFSIFCRDALVGIIRTGGLPSLYAGWGAVLCRNIPHSVIKVTKA